MFGAYGFGQGYYGQGPLGGTPPGETESIINALDLIATVGVPVDGYASAGALDFNGTVGTNDLDATSGKT